MPLFKRMTHKLCTRAGCPNEGVPQPVGFFVCPEPTCSSPLTPHYETNRLAVAVASSLSGLLVVLAAWGAVKHVEHQAERVGMLAKIVCAFHSAACEEKASPSSGPSVVDVHLESLTHPETNARAGKIQVPSGGTYVDSREFKSGDRFRWGVFTSARYVYLWLETPDGAQRLSVAYAPQEARTYRLELPTDSSHSFQMGDQPGKERFLLVFSNAPVDRLTGEKLDAASYQSALSELRKRSDVYFHHAELNHQ